MRRVALCSYDTQVGWRVIANSHSSYDRVGVFKFGSIRLLRVPIDSTFKAGRFCNPRGMLNV